MGRPKKSVPAPAEIEPEEISQEEPEEDEIVGEEDDDPLTLKKLQGTLGGISKAEAVRQALAAGNDSPEAGIGYLHSVYGIVMTRQMFSSYKAQEKARQAKKAEATAPKKPEPAKRGPKPKAPLVEGYVAPPEKPRAAGDQVDLLDALTAMKPLIAQYGAEQVKKMVDLLG